MQPFSQKYWCRCEVENELIVDLQFYYQDEEKNTVGNQVFSENLEMVMYGEFG